MPRSVVAVFLCAALLLILLSSVGCSRQDARVPVAERGVIDLTGWDPARDGPVALDGQWEYYWDQLLAPDVFRAGADPPAMTGYLDFPGFWNDHVLDGRPLPGRGQATFRLRVLPGSAAHKLGLRLLSLCAAYRLWVNGQLVATAGVVGQSVEAETAERSLVLARLSGGEGPLDLVLQISNHYFRHGGVHYQLLLGEPDQLEQSNVWRWCWGMFFSGGLLVMSVYHLVLYFLRKKDLSTLYFGIYCLALVILNTSLASSYFLVNLFIPSKYTLLMSNVSLALYVVLPSLLYRFYRSLYPDVFVLAIKHVFDARSFSFLAIMLFLPSSYAYSVLSFYAVTSLLINVCCLVLLVLCFRRRYDDALLFLFGYVILAATALCELYNNIFGTSPEPLLPLGLGAFVLAQAFVLARRFTRAFTDVESMSQAMEASNVALRAEMEERNRLEREIINVSEEERRRMGHELHDGLCQQLTGARLRCSVLERDISSGPRLAPGFLQLSALLNEAVDHAYDLSRGLWPAEHEQMGVKPSLEAMVQRFQTSSGIPSELRQHLGCETCASSHLTQVFRIAQEAIANAVKHSRATSISVELSCTEAGGISLAVIDNGTGIQPGSPASGGLGLRIMAYRARVVGGDFAVSDTPGGGATVTCTAPCRNAKPRPEAG